MYAALARMASAQRIELDLAERLRLVRELGGAKVLMRECRRRRRKSG